MITATQKRTRRWPRYQLDVPVRLIVHTARKTSVIVGRGNELNEGGLAVTAGVELRLGDETEIEFTPPYSNSPIRIRGVVRNRTGYRYGVEFVAADDREVEDVQRFKTLLCVLSTA
jgi:PilZ domain